MSPPSDPSPGRTPPRPRSEAAAGGARFGPTIGPVPSAVRRLRAAYRLWKTMPLPVRLRSLARTFVTGLLAVLPLAVTITVLVWMGMLVYHWLGPHSILGSILIGIGVGVAGSEAIAYLFGIVIVLAFVFLLGLAVESGVQRGLRRAVNTMLLRIPVVRTIYDVIDRFVALVTKKDGKEGLKSMSPVWCHFGGPGGAAVLGLLSGPTPVELNGRPYLAVLIPTAPVPIGGGLLYVPQEWVQPADLGVEAVTSIYVSMGVSSSQYLKSFPTGGTPHG